MPIILDGGDLLPNQIPNAKSGIPATLQAGDSAIWKDGPWSVYSDVDEAVIQFTSAEYSLIYGIVGPSALSVTAVPLGDGWKTTITPAQSAALQTGRYAWSAYLSKTGFRLSVLSGWLTVTANLATQVAGYDPRSEAEKALAACEAALANGAGVVEYTLGDRHVRKTGAADILKACHYWREVVAREKAAASLSAGLGNPRRLFVRF